MNEAIINAASTSESQVIESQVMIQIMIHMPFIRAISQTDFPPFLPQVCQADFDKVLQVYKSSRGIGGLFSRRR